MIRRHQYDSDSRPVYFAIEDIHEANWWQPLSEPIPPPRIHVSVIPYDMFRPVYFAPEAPHVPVFQPPNHTPPRGPANRNNLRNAGATGGQPGLQSWLQDYEFYAGGYVGEELTTMDKWYQPIGQPGRPKRLPVAALPYTWLVQFQSPVFPVPPMATWDQPLSQPLPRPILPTGDYPFGSFIRLPNVYGCIEAEITEFYIARAWPEPQMPVLQITRWYPHTAVPSCDRTQQSPATQPQYFGG